MKPSQLLTSILLTILLCSSLFVNGQNPIVEDVGMADPHVYIFGDTAYMYTSRDRDRNATNYVMPDWRVWSSPDLVNWTERYTIDPANNHMGPSTRCWAGAAAAKNGKYYWYFSNGANKTTGVMDSDSPTGPFFDALGYPLLDEDATPGVEYDPAVLVDDDGSAYIIAGHNRVDDPNLAYYVAKLGDDMISLAETPREIILTNPQFGFNNDKPSIHKYNGKYYLAAAVWYAVSDNIYGPYTILGKTAPKVNPWGLDGPAHGNFFTWNNQWFHAWCDFVGSSRIRYRESYMGYIHYKDNGEMIDDTVFLAKHFATGIGRYDANWDEIEAEWYMKADRIEKRESPAGGFEIQKIRNNATLYYPNVANLSSQKSIIFAVASGNGGTIEVRKDHASGTLLGSIVVPNTGGWSSYQQLTCPLTNLAGVKNICLKFIGAGLDLMHLDKFRFAGSGNPVVHLKKGNATGFAIDGGNGGENSQLVKLWDSNENNVNQQWIEISRGNGYYSYQKRNTSYCLDGGNGGQNGSQLKLWTCSSTNQNQQWKKVRLSNNTYQLVKRNANTFAVDGGNGGARNQNVKLWTENSANGNQQWIITTLGSGARTASETDQVLENPALSVYPNPANDRLNIDFQGKDLKNAKIEITDISGRQIYEQKLSSPSTQVTISDWKQGIYVLKVANQDKVTSMKFVIK